jgi:ribosomal protein S3AE
MVGFFRGVSPRVIKKFMGSALTWYTIPSPRYLYHNCVGMTVARNDTLIG